LENTCHHLFLLLVKKIESISTKFLTKDSSSKRLEIDLVLSKPWKTLHSSNAFLAHSSMSLLIVWLCHNPSLGLVTKARACKGVGQEEARESHLMPLGV